MGWIFWYPALLTRMSTLPSMSNACSASWARRGHVGEVGADEVTANLVGGLLPNVEDVR